MSQTPLAHGAEAVLSLIRQDNNIYITKIRTPKPYRLPELDNELRAFRTRREAKVLDRLKEISFPAPRLLQLKEKDMQLNIEYIKGKKLKDCIGTSPEAFSWEMGKKVALLHQYNIIHGDLTTSNMIVEADTGQLRFIDFGLSFFSAKPEDKAVDLHLLGRALESTHPALHAQCFGSVLKAYSQAHPGSRQILDRLQVVQARGRNKKKAV